MIFRGFLTIAVLACGLGAAPVQGKAPKGPNADDIFLAAYDAFRAGSPIRLQKAGTLPAGHVLAPYPEYWRLKIGRAHV